VKTISPKEQMVSWSGEKGEKRREVGGEGKGRGKDRGGRQNYFNLFYKY
jgi:hypothetical protein